MKEKLYTIPLNDAINAGDECPFCYIERITEQHILDFTLGSSSSYMESDIREATDKAGFCRFHFKKMFDYGNTLGNAWILKTHYEKITNEMKEQFRKFQPDKSGFMDKFKAKTAILNTVSNWAAEKDQSCYICDQFKQTYKRYLDTFFHMYKKDEKFRDKLKNSKGFCLHHFGEVCQAADVQLSDKEKAIFYPEMFTLMETNMERILEDVSWLVDKFDYRNKDADWKNSKDAIQRGMQKLKGGYPGDPVYSMKK